MVNLNEDILQAIRYMSRKHREGLDWKEKFESHQEKYCGNFPLTPHSHFKWSSGVGSQIEVS